MKAQQVIRAKEMRDDGSIVELVVWLLPASLEPCTHRYKYRLYYGAQGVCFIRYDNGLGKGDHYHKGSIETPYLFESLEKLLLDFQHDVETWGNNQ